MSLKSMRRWRQALQLAGLVCVIYGAATLWLTRDSLPRALGDRVSRQTEVAVVALFAGFGLMIAGGQPR
jgi:hypothetical protein